ncbi:MAG: toprim domain-containing protein, partial [Candidatus Thorarchaeota archaeon]
IIVEGRADILNLMKYGINNTVAVEGTHIPKSIADLTRKRGKKVIAFLDGDRGGDLILRELMQVAKIDYIARAPEGKEVEELSRPEVDKALQTRIPADQALALVSDRRPSERKKPSIKRPKREPRARREDRRPSEEHERPVYREPRRERPPRRPVLEVDDTYLGKIDEIKETFKAVIFDAEKNIVAECGVADLAKTLESTDNADAIVFDGVVTQRLADSASTKNVKLLIGAAVADLDKRPRGLQIATFDDLIE